MATYTVINGHDADLSNINAGGVDVGALTYRDGVTLTNTELAALLDGSSFGTDIAVVHDLTGDAAASQKKRSIAIAAQKLNGLA